MKLIAVPEDFRSQFTLPADGLNERVKNRATVYIPDNVVDSRGIRFPIGPMRLIGAYANDIVKVRAGNGEEFILRRQQVLAVHRREIVHAWLLELFKKQMEPLVASKDLNHAAFLADLPPVAVWSKLNKARKYGIPVPAWFK